MNMTINFTLSLSSNGVCLFQRVPSGWHFVGKTAVDVPNLAAAITQLRADAARLDPKYTQVKLLIPNTQIKYITLETAQTDLKSVMNALENSTPYSMDELVIDFDRNGGRTYIAAVARETLKEAQDFAVEHGFIPVAFTAVAAPLTFKSEVFFGPAFGSNSDVAIIRDTHPFIQTGIAIIPPDPDAAPLFTPRPRMADPASIKPVQPPMIAQEQNSKKNNTAEDKTFFNAPPPAIPKTTAHINVVQVSKLGIEPITVSVPLPVVDPDPAQIANTLLEADDLAKQGGFSTSRKIAAPLATPTRVRPAATQSKNKKLEDFATKQAQPIGGKPRFLGLMLTAILIIFMAIVWLWASTLSEENLANWFGFKTGAIVEVADVTQTTIAPVIQKTIVVVPAAAKTTSPALPQLRENVAGKVLSPAQADRIYAATGVWQRSPRLPLEPRLDSIAPEFPKPTSASLSFKLQEMPLIASILPDLTIVAPVNPLAPGIDFELDKNGLVRATPEGALTPQGILVYLSAPPLTPPLRPDFSFFPVQNTSTFAQTKAGTVSLSGLRPSLRPEDLTPNNSTAKIKENSVLAFYRPKARTAGLILAFPALTNPPDITRINAAIDIAVQGSRSETLIESTVQASIRPDIRPRNFARVVARARDVQAQRTARATVAELDVATLDTPERSSGNTAGDVALAATLDNAIRLRDVNLIGVYGRPNNRRALVRLGNGRYVKVEIGSNLDGGYVKAIGDNALSYVKSGETIALKLPSG